MHYRQSIKEGRQKTLQDVRGLVGKTNIANYGEFIFLVPEAIAVYRYSKVQMFIPAPHVFTNLKWNWTPVGWLEKELITVNSVTASADGLWVEFTAGAKDVKFRKGGTFLILHMHLPGQVALQATECNLVTKPESFWSKVKKYFQD